MSTGGAIMMLTREVVDLRKKVVSLEFSVIELTRERDDLKQQLHAYREYHDARDHYQSVENAWRDLEVINRVRKANAELQLLRNAKK